MTREIDREPSERVAMPLPVEPRELVRYLENMQPGDTFLVSQDDVNRVRTTAWKSKIRITTKQTKDIFDDVCVRVWRLQ